MGPIQSNNSKLSDSDFFEFNFEFDFSFFPKFFARGTLGGRSKYGATAKNTYFWCCVMAALDGGSAVRAGEKRNR